MEVSKIQFSSAEEELMKNGEVILTKNRVLEKWKRLLENVQDDETSWVGQSHLKQHPVFLTSGKVSRGEQYLGLPWLILDYPRAYTGRDLFFIRHMFWWGKFFSTTLHLAGKHKEAFLPAIIQHYPELQQFSLGIAEDPWMHHFDTNNYISLSSLSREAFEAQAMNGDHLKLAIAYPLEMWQQAESLFKKNWFLLLEKVGLVANTV